MDTQGKERITDIQGKERVMDTQGKGNIMDIQGKESSMDTPGEGGSMGIPGEGSTIGSPGEGGAEGDETLGRIETMRGLCGAIVDRLDQLAEYQRAYGRLTLRDPFCRVVAEAVWALAMAVEARAHENLNATRRADALRAAGATGAPGMEGGKD